MIKYLLMTEWLKITNTGRKKTIGDVCLPINMIGEVDLPIGDWNGDPQLDGGPGNFTALTPPDGQRRDVIASSLSFTRGIFVRVDDVLYFLPLEIDWHDITRRGVGGDKKKWGEPSRTRGNS